VKAVLSCAPALQVIKRFAVGIQRFLKLALAHIGIAKHAMHDRVGAVGFGQVRQVGHCFIQVLLRMHDRFIFSQAAFQIAAFLAGAGALQRRIAGQDARCGLRAW
jgi:hypothetical protein